MVQPARSEIEHKEPIVVGFIILQYAKLKMLELFYKFFLQKFVMLMLKRRWKWIPIHCLALAKKKCLIRYEMRKGQSWHCNAVKTVIIPSQQMLAAIPFPGNVVPNTGNMIKENLNWSRENFYALKCCVCVARHTVVTILWVESINSTVRS